MGRRNLDLPSFKQSLDRDAPPAHLEPALAALWHEAKGNWDQAHQLAQTADGADGAWAHAYLHRVEGNLPNAGYWYRRAGKPPSSAPLTQVWNEIANALLAE